MKILHIQSWVTGIWKLKTESSDRSWDAKATLTRSMEG